MTTFPKYSITVATVTQQRSNGSTPARLVPGGVFGELICFIWPQQIVGGYLMTDPVSKKQT